MEIFKNKYGSTENKANDSAKQASAQSQKQEENYRNLLRENSNTGEKQASSRLRRRDKRKQTKTEKISTGVGLAGIATILGTELFAVAATATGALSSAAIATYSGAMLAVGVAGMAVGSVGLYTSLILEKLSKRKEHKKAPEA